MRFLRAIVLIGLLVNFQLGFGQLIVNNAAPYNNPVFLVNNVLLSTGVTVSNVTFNGSSVLPVGANANMIGYFNGGSSNINIAEGVIINTGSIFDAPGPNDACCDGIDNGTTGDVDLLTLTGGTQTFNAAVLEFDFETVTDAVSFRYVFASEEYNEYVCSIFNDVFGFFISGPGITGPFSNGAENIALIPSSGTYVGINTVNNGTVGSAGSIGGCGGPGDPGLYNTVYYVDNEALGQQSVQYDGFTTVLTAQRELTPCTVYHIKLAVTDVGDGIFDSGVFLEAASFGAVGIQVQVGQVGAPVASVVEGCDSMIFTFSRPGSTSLPLIINFIISGSASNGVDYDFFPGSVTIPVGQSSISFAIEAFLDSISESLEDIVITIPANLTNNTCIDDVPSTAMVTIVNTDPMTLQTSNDTTICPGDNVQLTSTVTGGIPPYTYSWSPPTALSCTTCPNPVASPSLATTYTLSVTDNCGTAVLNQDVAISVGGILLTTPVNLVSVEGCSNATFTFIRTGPTTNPEVVYFTIGGSATNGIDYAFILDSVIIPAGQSSVSIDIIPFMDGSVELNESVIITTVPDTNSSFCSSPDPITATVYIMNVDPITLTASPDTLMCGGVSVMLTADGAGGVPPLTYTWTEGTDTLGSTPFLNIAPMTSTTYTVVVNDTCGNPVATEYVLVTVKEPPPMIMALGDTAYEGCRNALFTIIRYDSLMASLTINYTISGSASNGVDFPTIPDSVVIPAGQSSADILIQALADGIVEGNETLIITLPRDSTDTVCFVIPFTDTVVIMNVDLISLSANGADICPGDTVTLTAIASGGIGPLQYLWNDGSTGTSINVAPAEPTIYSVTTSDSCGNTANVPNILVNVKEPLGSVLSSGALAYEGCVNTLFDFYLPVPLSSDFVIHYSIGGTAANGMDYESIIDSIVIPAGMLSSQLVIEPIFDGNSEGNESIAITILPTGNDTLCPHIFTSSAAIADVAPVSVTALGDTVICNWDAELSAIAIGGMGAISYNWNNSAGNGDHVIVSPTGTTTYTVTAYDSCRSSTATDSVIIEIDCEYLFHIPTAFTPNDDGVNDVFNAKWKGVKTYEVYIYNRWGDLIFKSSDKNLGWDGRGNDGKFASEQEVYVYVFETTDFLDFPHSYVGRVILIR